MNSSAAQVNRPDMKIDELFPQMTQLVRDEAERQRCSVDMIASSNIPIPGVPELGSVLGNKSSPGNVGH